MGMNGMKEDDQYRTDGMNQRMEFVCFHQPVNLVIVKFIQFSQSFRGDPMFEKMSTLIVELRSDFELFWLKSRQNLKQSFSLQSE